MKVLLISQTRWDCMIYLQKFVLLVGVIGSITNAHAQQSSDPALSLQRIFMKPYIAGTRPNDPTVSPDGKFIIFRWDSSAQNKLRYWFMLSDGSGKHMIPDTLLGEFAWSPDSKMIACVRKGDIFLTDTSFRTFERLTKTEAFESGLHWSPDGKDLAFSSENKILVFQIGKTGVFDIAKESAKEASLSFMDFTADSKRILFVEFNNEGLPEFIIPRYTGKDVSTSSGKGGVSKSKIGIAPVDTGNTIWIKLPGEERFYFGDLDLSPDGKRVLIERFSSDRKKREVYMADTDSGKPFLISEESNKAWVEGGLAETRWMPDGKRFITTSEKDGWNHLYSMTPQGKDIRTLTDGEWEVHWFEILPSGESIVFQANKDDHNRWQLFSLDLKTKKITRLTTRDGTYENPSLAKNGTFIVASYSDFNVPGELVRVSTALENLTAVASSAAHPSVDHGVQELPLTQSVPEEFSHIKWVRPEIIHFKSRDGKSIPAMIYKPNDFDPTKKYPVVVFVHGAGYIQNVYRGWGWYYREAMFHTRLTQRGYVAFEVDYRGSAGYGRDYRTDIYLHLGGKDLDDEIDGIEYLKSLGYIDPQRVGIYGGSYGGFMTLMGLFLSDTYACGAALRAVTSWENYYRHNSHYTEARLGKPENNPEAYKISSPLTYADSLKKPLLILHGMVDNNVYFQDAVQLMKVLQKSRKKFEVMMYPDEAHAFTEPESWLDEYSRIEEFFDKYLQDRKN